MRLYVPLCIVASLSVLNASIQSTTRTTTSESHLLQLEQTVADLQSHVKVQDQKYAAVLSSLLSKLTAKSEEVTSVTNELSALKSDHQSLKIEFDLLKMKVASQTNHTLRLTSDLNTTTTGLLSVMSDVEDLTRNVTSSFSVMETVIKCDLNRTLKNLTSLKDEVNFVHVNLSSDIEDIKNNVFQIQNIMIPHSPCQADKHSTEAPKTGEGCPPGFVHNGSSCYLFSRLTGHYSDAYSLCQYFASHLAVISSKEEDGFIRTFIEKHENGSYYYIGGSDLRQEGTWTWGCLMRNMTYTNWGPGQPNNVKGREHCLVLHPLMSYKWGDEPCNYDYRFICERRAEKHNQAPAA